MGYLFPPLMETLYPFVAVGVLSTECCEYCNSNLMPFTTRLRKRRSTGKNSGKTLRYGGRLCQFHRVQTAMPSLRQTQSTAI